MQGAGFPDFISCFGFVIPHPSSLASSAFPPFSTAFSVNAEKLHFFLFFFPPPPCHYGSWPSKRSSSNGRRRRGQSRRPSREGRRQPHGRGWTLALAVGRRETCPRRGNRRHHPGEHGLGIVGGVSPPYWSVPCGQLRGNFNHRCLDSTLASAIRQLLLFCVRTCPAVFMHLNRFRC